MAASLVYRQPVLYEAVMIALYGRHYGDRYRAIADLVPAGSTVLDLCCGPAVLYHRYLRRKGVTYTGLDLSEPFIESLRRSGGQGQVWDLQSETPLPPADFVVMQASLAHFLPNARPVVNRMLQAARQKVIIAEPVRNMTSSSNPVLAAIGRRFTDPGNGRSAHRFTEESLDAFFASCQSRVRTSFLIPGGREKVFVLDAGPDRTPE